MQRGHAACPGTPKRCQQGLQKRRELASEISWVHASSGQRIGTFFVINIMPQTSMLLTYCVPGPISKCSPGIITFNSRRWCGWPLTPPLLSSPSQRLPGTQLQLNKVGIIGSWQQGRVHSTGNYGRLGKGWGGGVGVLERTYYRVWACVR